MAAGQIVVFPPIAGPLPFATVAQLKQALAIADPSGLVKFHLPADPQNNITMGWYEDQFPNRGALYDFVALKLGYTVAQMIAFYLTLSTFPARP